VDADGDAYLTDFGLVRVVDSSAPGQTAVGTIVGTFAYMAPEQTYPSRRIDGRADQYALACTLYEAACGRTPFGGDGDVQLVLAHRLEEPPPIGSFSDRAAIFDEALQRALAKEPDDRYATCRELAQALRRAALGSESSLPAVPPVAPAAAGPAEVAPTVGRVAPT